MLQQLKISFSKKIKTIERVVAVVFPMLESSVNLAMIWFTFSHSHNPYRECTPPPAVDVGGCISNMFIKMLSVRKKVRKHLQTAQPVYQLHAIAMFTFTLFCSHFSMFVSFALRYLRNKIIIASTNFCAV